MNIISTKKGFEKYILIALFLLIGADLFAQQKMGDNLGNHKATAVLNMNVKSIVNAAGMVIGQSTFTSSNVILDITSTNKAIVIPRITNLSSLATGPLINGMMVYDIATAKFMVRQNNAWGTFGSYNLAAGQIMIGNLTGDASPVTVSGDMTLNSSGTTTIGAGKVLLNMLGTDPAVDIEKVYTTNASGLPEFSPKSSFALAKYSVPERDLKYSTANPAPDHTIIFNTTYRVLQTYDKDILQWVDLGAVPASKLPIVNTQPPADLNSFDLVNISGEVVSDGGLPVSARGLVYSTTTRPTLSNTTIAAAAGGTGTFSTALTTLSASTTYYARSYATNTTGTVYGNEIKFTTSAALPPVVSTTVVTAITNYNAVSGGNVSSEKGSPVTARGIVWSTTLNPTLGVPANTITSGTGSGAYSVTLTGLKAATVYHVRAFATNAKGTGYGADVTFTTAPASVPLVSSTTPVTQSGTIATSGGVVANNGGAVITSKGIAWSTTNTFPTSLTSSNSVTEGSSAVGSFSANIVNVTPGTSYYVWAYATNSSGTGYAIPVQFTSFGLPIMSTTTTLVNNAFNTLTVRGTVTNEGGTPVTERGFLYSRKENGMPVYGGANTVKVLMGTGAGNFDVTVTGLLRGRDYYFIPYAINAIGGPVYGEDITVRTVAGIVNTYTSGMQTFVVPSSVTSVEVTLIGGGGGAGPGGGTGGYGGTVTGTLAVTPGSTLYIYVGGKGGDGTAYPSRTTPAGGYNGGGAGSAYISSATSTGYYGGAGGGGASDIRVGGTGLTRRVAVAGGGGGAGGGNGNTGGNDGGNGGRYGGNGLSSSDSLYPGVGKGATFTGGGAGGNFSSDNIGANGSTGSGGAAAAANNYIHGAGGGGGGFYGGGGGTSMSGGGGGSSTTGSLTAASYGPLATTLAGSVIIAY